MKKKNTFCETFFDFKIYTTEFDKSFYQKLIKDEDIDFWEKIGEKENYYLSQTLIDLENILKYLPKKEDNKLIEKVQVIDKEEPIYQVEFLSHTIRLKNTLEKIIRK